MTQVVAVSDTEIQIITVGSQGPSGVGVPPGGTTGQVLTKVSDDDYDTEWENGGPGGGVSSLNSLTGAVNITSDNGSIIVTPDGEAINLETNTSGTISGSIADGQVAVGSGDDEISGSEFFKWDAVNKILTIKSGSIGPDAIVRIVNETDTLKFLMQANGSFFSDFLDWNVSDGIAKFKVPLGRTGIGIDTIDDLEAAMLTIGRLDNYTGPNQIIDPTFINPITDGTSPDDSVWASPNGSWVSTGTSALYTHPTVGAIGYDTSLTDGGADYAVNDPLTLVGGNNDAHYNVGQILSGIAVFVDFPVATPGTDYAPDEEYYVNGGDGNAIIKVDTIDGFNGLETWHVTDPGTNYNVNNVFSVGAPVAGGSGTGAEIVAAADSDGPIYNGSVPIGQNGSGYALGVYSLTGGSGTGATVTVNNIETGDSTLYQTGPLDSYPVVQNVSVDMLSGSEGSITAALDGGDSDSFDAGTGVQTFSGYWQNSNGKKIIITPTADFDGGTITNVIVGKSIVTGGASIWSKGPIINEDGHYVGGDAAFDENYLFNQYSNKRPGVVTGFNSNIIVDGSVHQSVQAGGIFTSMQSSGGSGGGNDLYGMFFDTIYQGGSTGNFLRMLPHNFRTNFWPNSGDWGGTNVSIEGFGASANLTNFGATLYGDKISAVACTLYELGYTQYAGSIDDPALIKRLALILAGRAQLADDVKFYLGGGINTQNLVIGTSWFTYDSILEEYILNMFDSPMQRFGDGTWGVFGEVSAQDTGWDITNSYTPTRSFDPGTVDLPTLAAFVATQTDALKNYGVLGPPAPAPAPMPSPSPAPAPSPMP